MHVLLLYNEPTLPSDHADAASEREVLVTARHVAKELRQAGFRVTELAISTDPEPLLALLRRDRPEVVFNLFEGTAPRPAAEAFGLALLEWLDVPFTGCPMQASVLARDKPRAKLLLQGAGLPTPRFFLIEQSPLPGHGLDWPLILKPAYEDASVGVEQASVVTNPGQLEQQALDLLERFGPPLLVEEFIDGREFNVSLIENPELRVLPIAEIQFRGRKQGLWPIVTYQAKWNRNSAEDLATLPRCPAEVAPRLAGRVRDLAQRAYRLFGCRDYARVDFRVNRRGEPYILEVNPNPDYDPSAGLAKALKAAGLSHKSFTVDLVRQAAGRAGQVVSTNS
jgi:D-alanine-D-alanine ligase